MLFRSAPAGGNAAASEKFVGAFLDVKKAEELEKSGDLKSALETSRAAASALEKIKKESPDWQKDLVDFRLKRTAEAAERLAKKLGETSVASTIAAPSRDHLFGSEDELFFQPQNTITPAQIDRARFFLSAHSRSPELNLFGRPRVTIWPLSGRYGYEPSPEFGRPGVENPSDDLFQFASTADDSKKLGKESFVFDREDS